LSEHTIPLAQHKTLHERVYEALLELIGADVLAPVRNDSAELYYDPKLGPPNRKAALGMQRWTTPLPAHERVSWTEMLAPVTEWQPKILDGSAPVKDGLTQMAAQVNALLGAPR
jgi:hypothetical protein